MNFFKDDIVNEIVKRPHAYLIMQQAKTILGDENQKRQKFYNTISENQKAEFINGEIIIHSPVRQLHNQTTLFIARLLSAFVDKYSLGYTGFEKILISLTRNDYEPDICFFKKEKSKKFKSSQIIFPSPDFIIEVLSKSTEKTDRGIKFDDYEAHAIEEYWIVDPEMQTIEQYHLENNRYKEIRKSDDGVIRSFVIENFNIPVSSVFNKDLNMQALSSILSS